MFGPTDPLRYYLSYNSRKVVRAVHDKVNASEFANELLRKQLSFIVKTEKSPIFRNFSNVRRQLFVNKITNLKLALEHINGILIEPGKTFSFWHLVGKPSAQKGYLPGLVIDRGRPAEGVGGGLCQLANMIHWLALHSDLEVTERHRHSFDIFRDDNRTVPFASGATIVYNYKDIRLKNNTNKNYQFLFNLTDEFLEGGLYTDVEQLNEYTVVEKEHAFSVTNDKLYRQNSLYQICKNRQKGHETETLIFRNYCQCQYSLDEGAI